MLSARHLDGEFYLGSYAEITAVMDATLRIEAQALDELRALLLI